MSVQMQQFRVVGVKTKTGEDVSIIIDAATKAAAEVKAEQMGIETTHIVRIKQEEPAPPDEHELFSTEAAEALAGVRTEKLIEEVVPPEEPRQSPVPPPKPVASTPAPQAAPEPHNVIAAITRPNYAAPTSRRDNAAPHSVSGMRAFGFVLVVLFCMTAGAYYVLVHEPNNVHAEDHELLFGEDLFIDVVGPTEAKAAAPGEMRDAFNSGGVTHHTAKPPVQKPDNAIIIRPQKTTPASAGGSSTDKPELQSVVTSHEGRFAVINGKFYKEGAPVAGGKLVNVADDWVLIEKDGKQFTLQIEAE